MAASASSDSTATGERVWAREVDAEKGDFLGLAGTGLLVAGGRPLYELADPASLRGHVSRLTALDLTTGRTLWRTTALEDTGTHVLGTADGLTVVLERQASEGTEDLVAIDEQGDTRVVGPAQVAGAARRGPARRVGCSCAAAPRGRRTTPRPASQLWRRTLPTTPQLLPYGFQLDDVPLLDDDHALVGTTTGLRVLDLRTGAFTATAPLPVDGINTTYWPYAGRRVAPPGRGGHEHQRGRPAATVSRAG